MKPIVSPEDRKYCKCQYSLEPHVSLIRRMGDKTIYDIDYWYCPSCGLMYGHVKDMCVHKSR